MSSAKKDWFFGKVTPDTAEATIRQMSRAWYFITAVQGVLIGLVVWMEAWPLADLLDPVQCFLGGYFLARRKSRAVAVCLLLYALGIGAMTVVARFGAIQGGKNIALVVVTLLIAWKGVRATWVYHDSNGLKTAWKRVAAVSAAAIAAALLVAFGISVAAALAFIVISDEDLGMIIMLGAAASALAVMVPATLRYPFAGPSTDRQIAQVFE